MGADDRLSVGWSDAAPEVLRDGFTMVPNSIIERTDVSPAAKFMFIVLLRYAWQSGRCWPSQETLAAHIGVKDRQVRRYRAELEDAGLVETEHRDHHNVYRLNVPPRYRRTDMSAGTAGHTRPPKKTHSPTDQQLPLDPSYSTAPGHAHAHAQEATPDPKPLTAQDAVAAWIDSRTASGKTQMTSTLRGQMAQQAKRLIRDGVEPEHVIEAAARIGRTHYGPGALAGYADDVANGIPERQARGNAFDHNPFEGGEGVAP